MLRKQIYAEKIHVFLKLTPLSSPKGRQSSGLLCVEYKKACIHMFYKVMAAAMMLYVLIYINY